MQVICCCLFKRQIKVLSIWLFLCTMLLSLNNSIAEESLSKAEKELLNQPHPISEDALREIEKSRGSDQWVEVTRPIISCGATNDDPNLKNLLLETLIRPSPDGILPEGCEMLRVGETYLLDDEQSEEDTKIVVKMWAGVCPKGCLPTMTPVYAPPRRLVGAYLRPTFAPPGW